MSSIRVLDLTWYIAGPYCTKLLADYGADVIKIEKPEEGDPARRLGPFHKEESNPEKGGLFLHLNTNKRGITLNLKTETGKALFRQLVAQVDILVENFSPRVMPSLGLGYENLEKLNPKLVMTSITNFGQTGPYRDFKASDMIIYGIGGDMWSSGIPEREPVNHATNVVLFQGGVSAAVGTMGAFYAARYHDIGQWIDVSLMETQASGIDRRPTNLIAYQYTGAINPRLPEMGMGYPAGTHPCKDGYFHIFGGAVWWDRVIKMLGEPEWIKGPKWRAPTAQSDPALREEFETHFLAWLMERTKRECFQEGQASGLPCAPLNTMDDLLADAHLNQRGAFTGIDHPVAGRWTYPARPYIMSETPWRVSKPAPLLGQHNEEIYGSLGYSREDLVRLRQGGII